MVGVTDSFRCPHHRYIALIYISIANRGLCAERGDGNDEDAVVATVGDIATAYKESQELRLSHLSQLIAAYLLHECLELIGCDIRGFEVT